VLVQLRQSIFGAQQDIQILLNFSQCWVCCQVEHANES